MKSIPTLNLQDFLAGGASKDAFVSELGKTYEGIGFVAIKGHLLSDALQEALYRDVKAFFALSDAEKARYEDPKTNGQRAYTGRGKEHAKNRNVGDLKEFYHVGQEIAPDDPEYAKYPKNVFPNEIPTFKENTVEAFRKLEATGAAMLRAIALYLDLPEDYFADKIYHGDSILRPIHYYPIDDPASVPEGAVRSAEHEDINLITLLMGASAEGLEVLSQNGQWVAVTAVPECVVVNVGDMLQRLTNNRLRSTTHRVVNPPKEKMHLPRFSVPFFLHPRPETSLACLANCITAERPKAYPDVTAGEYLDERLREIGLKK